MATTDGDLRVGVRWSKEEDKKLREKLAIHTGKIEGGLFKSSTVDWEDVSKYVGGRRNAIMCQNRWCQMTTQPGKGLAWTDDEDAGQYLTFLLIHLLSPFTLPFTSHNTPSYHPILISSPNPSTLTPPPPTPLPSYHPPTHPLRHHQSYSNFPPLYSSPPPLTPTPLLHPSIPPSPNPSHISIEGDGRQRRPYQME